MTFLRNHREAIAAMDFFSVPTITFSVLYVFFVIGHDRRRILHFNVTRHPTSLWIVKQLREAFPYEPVAKFLILDHDAKYGTEVPAAIHSMDIKTARTAVGCPWQNGVVERWVGSCRRELLDHVIAIDERHLKRLLASHIEYYPKDRTHCGLQKQVRIPVPPPASRSSREKPHLGRLGKVCRPPWSRATCSTLRSFPGVSEEYCLPSAILPNRRCAAFRLGLRWQL